MLKGVITGGPIIRITDILSSTQHNVTGTLYYTCSFQVENVLRSDRGHYVLCDFGSATAKVTFHSCFSITFIHQMPSEYPGLEPCHSGDSPGGGGD